MVDIVVQYLSTHELREIDRVNEHICSGTGVHVVAGSSFYFLSLRNTGVASMSICFEIGSDCLQVASEGRACICFDPHLKRFFPGQEGCRGALVSLALRESYAV
jgi:hypothetical protein